MLENVCAKHFDHALLKSEATAAQILQACRETREYGFFGLAVNPCWSKLVVENLAGSNSILVGVAGFPLGATTTKLKIAEALEQVQVCQGRVGLEIDMVANIGWLAADDLAGVEREIAEIRSALPQSVPLKVIIETPLISDSQQIAATRAVVNSGAQFVKTATGFFGAPDLATCRRLVSAARGEIQVKVSGGVRTLEQAQAYLAAGATRLGSSSSLAIMDAARAINEGASQAR